MENRRHKKTSLSTLGEFGLIDHLTGDISVKNPSTVAGVGDDAAVIEYPDRCVVVSTDLLLEGIHFNLVYTPMKHLGYKAVVVNLSDIYAMNALPRQITVSIGLSSKFCVEDADELYAGIKLACAEYGVDLVGGDTSSSMTGLLISITAIGEVSREKITYRKGSMPGDVICVSGNLGAAYLGLQLLERERRLFESDKAIQPNLEGYDYVLERQLKPEARRDIIQMLESKGVVPHSMIDLSDGLSSDLLHLCKRSGTGCRVYLDQLPIHPQAKKVAEEFHMAAETAALNGGEDYELLFTISPADYRKIMDQPVIRTIGHITPPEEGQLLVTSSGETAKLKAQGWNQMTSPGDHS
jgi:thiamine-monophosphate kinase